MFVFSSKKLGPQASVCTTESVLCAQLSQNPVCVTESILCAQVSPLPSGELRLAA